MKTYKLRNSVSLAVLPVVVFLISAGLFAFIRFVVDAEYLFQPYDPRRILVYSSVCLEAAVMLGAMIGSYLAMDAAFSTELGMDENGIAIRGPWMNIFIAWNQVAGRKEEKTLGGFYWHYFLCRPSVPLFNAGIPGKILSRWKTNIILYSLFEDEAVFLIDKRLSEVR